MNLIQNLLEISRFAQDDEANRHSEPLGEESQANPNSHSEPTGDESLSSLVRDISLSLNMTN